MSKKQYKHWQIEQDDNQIAWLYLNYADGSTNILTKHVLDELKQILENLPAMNAAGLIISSKKSNGFLAGADITEFTALKTSEAAFKKLRFGQSVFDLIEKLPFPTLALIHGFCLGGGLELALACTYRVAENSAKCKLGLPEVRLGIHPGYGGAVRLPELIGDLPAMQLMLAGRVVVAKQAKRMGIVDAAVPVRQMRVTAIALVKSGKQKRQPSWLSTLASYPIAKQASAFFMRQQIKKRISPTHYPAPYKLLECWKNFSSNRQQKFIEEASSVTDLFANSPGTQQLVRVFMLQERMKSLAKSGSFEPQHVHVVGAGIMGGDIAAWCAMQGFQVTLQDREPKYIAPAIKRAHKLFDKKIRDSHLCVAAKDRLMPDHHGAGVGKADVVIEAIYENLEAKQALYAQIEPQIREDTILATNTSSLPLEVLSEKLADPSRLVGLHFFNPVAKMQLVEIIHADNTNQQVLDNSARFVKKISRLPLPVKSSPGFLVNRILMPYIMEAIILVDEGVAPEIIDYAAVDFGMPMGPIELADVVGLDICSHVGKVLADAFNLPTSDRLQQKLDQGELGRKSGQGFYLWKNGKVSKQNKSNIPVDKQVQDRLILSLVNETVKCLEEELVADADLLDAGVIFGTGFAPFRGGPIQYARSAGSIRLRDRLSELQSKCGERFKSSAGWSQL
ncbi:MAG: 3-hydroxyacyl-CoA dehydrogenase NAD-binding domain-containing protein [Gammaproteobacteria bacterium]|nr:3-hydroxyacyl-CoA dehydrogenase NAD-binding domain-containing protein [Gammaproteobacteria bacterium]